MSLHRQAHAQKSSRSFPKDQSRVQCSPAMFRLSMRGVFSTSNKWLSSHPVKTKALISAILLGTADVMAQTVELQSSSFHRQGEDSQHKVNSAALRLRGDIHRAVRTCPFRILRYERQVSLHHARRSKLFVDIQSGDGAVCYRSWFLNGSYLGFMALTNGKTAHQAKKEVQERIMPIQQKTGFTGFLWRVFVSRSFRSQCSSRTLSL